MCLILGWDEHGKVNRLKRFKIMNWSKVFFNQMFYFPFIFSCLNRSNKNSGGVSWFLLANLRLTSLLVSVSFLFLVAGFLSANVSAGKSSTC